MNQTPTFYLRNYFRNAISLRYGISKIDQLAIVGDNGFTQQNLLFLVSQHRVVEKFRVNHHQPVRQHETY